MVYLFIGQDSLSKDIKLKRIKQEYLPGPLEDFNLDILYARELHLKGLQERLLSFPIKAKKRIIVIREAGNLKKDIKEFILKYVRKPISNIVLILDITQREPKDEFLDHIARYAQVCRFNESPRLDTFTLSRQIDLKETNYALHLLSQLLKNGEKPERILGGLRYAWEKSIASPFQMRKRLKFLLNCDIDMKRGLLKPDLALERLVVQLCCLQEKPLR